MDFRQIQYFLCLFEEGNVTRAAQRLHVVQPAVSMQLAKLEREFGQKLFDRTADGMIPTSAGRLLYERFLPIMQDISNAQQEVAGLAGRIFGRLNVGVLSSIGNSVLATSMATFTDLFPDVDISVKEAYSGELADGVLSGRLDVAVVNKPNGHLALSSVPIIAEEFCIISRADSKISVSSLASLKNVVGHKLVLLSKPNSLRVIVDDHAKRAGFDLRPHLSLDGLLPIIDLVVEFDWITVLPPVSTYPALKRGSVKAHPISSPRMKRFLQWVHHPRRPLTPAAQKFMDVMNRNLVEIASQAVSREQK